MNRNFDHRHFVDFNHRRFNHRRFVAFGFFPATMTAIYGYYGGGCGWPYRNAVVTGSPYWWNRYQDCIGIRLTTVVSVSHVDLKIDRAMKTPRSLAGETEVSLTRAMAPAANSKAARLFRPACRIRTFFSRCYLHLRTFSLNG